jgi:hypothetical protein
MTATHTPGPWHVETHDTILSVCCTPTRAGEFPEICFQERDGHPEHGSITGRKRTSEELAANARLIAAAPELLDACRFALFTLQHREGLRHRLDLFTEDERSMLRKAIEKAEGSL